MRAEAVMMQLLTAAGVAGLVGTRVSLARMVEGDPYPAIVIEVVSGTLVPPINAVAGMQTMQTRVQVTALGKNVSDVKNVLEQVRIACEFQSGLIAGVRVMSVLRDSIGPDTKNDEISVYLQSTDYMLTYYET